LLDDILDIDDVIDEKTKEKAADDKKVEKANEKARLAKAEAEKKREEQKENLANRDKTARAEVKRLEPLVKDL
jgi:hypothetical protein